MTGALEGYGRRIQFKVEEERLSRAAKTPAVPAVTIIFDVRLY
jgi:hypothetical protein